LKNLSNNLNNFYKQNQTKFQKFFLFLVIVIALISIFERSQAWYKSPSFFIDEANVVRNIAERSYTQLWDRLDYEQYIPPLLASNIKVLTDWIGVSEKSSRLIPFLASIFCLLLGFLLAKKYLKSNLSIAVILTFYSFTYLSLALALQVKQYTSDLCITLGLLLMALHFDYKESTRNKMLLLWTLIGTCAVWYSMPSVFILASIGIYYFINAFKEKAHLLFLKNFSIPVLIWIVNFFIYFFFILKSDADTSYLQNYHDQYFINLKLWQKKAFMDNWFILKTNMHDFVGRFAISMVWAILFFWAGILSLVKHWKNTYLLLVLPIAFCCIASILHYYSLIPRLNYFLLFNALIICMLGFEYLVRKLNIWIKPLLYIFTLLVLIKLNGWQFIFHPKIAFVEETKKALYYVAQNKKSNEDVLVSFGAVAAFEVYTNYHKNKAHFKSLDQAQRLGWEHNAEVHLKQYFDKSKNKSVWFIWGHDPQESISRDIQSLQNNYMVLKQEQYWRSAAILIQEK